MGRPALTLSQRIDRIPEEYRLPLMARQADWERAKHELDRSRAEFKAIVEKALAEGANIRDIGVMLGMNHQTVQELVKPYRKPRAA